MNDDTARLLAAFGRPGELEPEDAAALDAHLAAHPDFAASLAADRDFDAKIGRAMRDVPVPAGLAGRLLDGVAAQRGTWYRQKAYGLAAMAAAIAIGVGGFVAYRVGTKSDLSLTSIVDQVERDESDHAGSIDRALARHNLAYNPSRDFDLRQLEFAGTGDLNGKQVPVLYFVNGEKNARAKVYVVKDSDFAWKKLPQDGSSVANKFGLQVAVLTDRKRADVAYIVVFTGAGLEVFLEGRESL